MRDHSNLMQLSPANSKARFPALEIDLFVSRLSFQLPRSFSWIPDPLVKGTNAFVQDREGLKAYANPPWSLKGRVLTKTEDERAVAAMLPQVAQSTNNLPSEEQE